LAAYDRRKQVRISLKTTNEREAAKRASIYDDFIEKYWRDLVRGDSVDTDLSEYHKTVALAQAHGFAYKDMSEIATGSLDELLARTEAIEGRSVEVSAALLGAVKPLQLKLSGCPDKYRPLCSDRLVERSELQVRKYMNPRNAALRDFMKAVGDIPLSRIDRAVILKFRTWLMKRVARNEITGHTANKQIGFVKDILITVGMNEQIDTDFKPLFVDVRLVENVESRPPFEAAYVQKTFLSGNAFEGMNEQAQMLIYMMVETGARESELIGLMPEDYFLNEKIPYIWIRKNQLRSLKTRTSDRQIPLVGVSLMAAKRICATGLTRYQASPDTASASIGKYLREHDLKPTPRHSLYSLRHTFKDRLRDEGAPEEVIDELMGHKKAGPKYGRGHLLDTKYEWLQKITFKPPKKFHLE
jgi:integrase